ncbi:MAG: AhpC/TSA family protein, partial [Mesorhizobium sp.]
MAADDQTMTLEQSVQAAVELDAPLNERLEVVARAVRRLNGDFADAVDRLVSRLQEQGAGAMAPAPGDLMPAFLLPDDSGQLIGLA